MTQNHYQALNIAEDASREEIHNAYRELARKYHPDRNKDAGAARIMAVINAAYAVLSEPAKRAGYDRDLRPVSGTVDNVVLAAARDVLCGRGWGLGENQAHRFTLTNGARLVSVVLVPALTAVTLSQYSRLGSFTAILTLRVEEGIGRRPTPCLIIDVLRSRVVGGTFPDAVYEELFRPLL